MSSPVLPTGVEDSPPSAHKILVVIEPLLIDQDYYARVEDREIISNLAKAAGLAHMISTMRPDLDHQNEDVRNTTAQAFAVVAGALKERISSALPPCCV
jgi:splicing factor 3B subunit 1